MRWTLSDDDIILQLVANTGSDRYLALGIREISGLKAVSGDVIVGWISSKSGKGGIDDYFLAGDAIQCDDGAESCPDRSKVFFFKKAFFFCSKKPIVSVDMVLTTYLYIRILFLFPGRQQRY